MEYTVKVTPEGEIFFLYNDNSPLRDIGKLQLVRASNVEWDENEQAWVVWINNPKHPNDPNSEFKRKRLIKTFKKRADAIQAEIEILNERLSNGVPVEHLFL